MEIVNDSIDRINLSASRTTRYRMWKQPLHKWNSYVRNKNNQYKKIDWWDKKILKERVGKTVAYNCGGMFFKDFDHDIIALEHSACPVNVPGLICLQDNPDLKHQVDTLILINPIFIKYHHSLKLALTKSFVSRAGWQPSVSLWLSTKSKIFLSFSDYHLFYDRLRFSVHDWLHLQLADLETAGFFCKFSNIEKSHLDPVNGNVKLVLSRDM